MDLSLFPHAIAQHQQLLKAARQCVELSEARLGRLISAAASPSDIDQAQAACQSLRGAMQEAQIEVELLQNEFDVARLAEERAIAQMNLEAAQMCCPRPAAFAIR